MTSPSPPVAHSGGWTSAVPRISELARHWATVLEGNRLVWWSQTFLDPVLEDAFQQWFRRKNVRLVRIIGVFVTFLSLLFVVFSDILKGDGRPLVPNTIGVAAFRIVATAPMTAWAVLSVFGKDFLVRHMTFIVWAGVCTGIVGIMVRDVFDQDISATFTAIALCAQSACPSTSSHTRLLSQVIQWFALSVITLAFYFEPVRALEKVVVPLFIMLGQITVVAVIQDRETRRHYLFCHSTQESSGEQKNSRTFAEAASLLRLGIFFNVPQESWWSAELRFRASEGRRNRDMTSLALLAFALTGGTYLLIEILVGHAIGLATLIAAQSVSIFATLLVSATLSAGARLLGRSAGLYALFDLAVLTVMLFAGAVLVYFEHVIRSAGSEPDSSRRFDDARLEEPSDESLYMLLLVKQIFVMIASFRIPVVFGGVGALGLILVRAGLWLSTSTAMLMLLWFTAVVVSGVRERQEKINFLMADSRAEEEENATTSGLKG
jgi:hypothetical protein